MGVRRKKGNWWIDYYAGGHRYREKIGPSKALAENVLRKRKLQIAEHRFLNIRKEKNIKFEDFASDYIELYSKHNKKDWKKDLTRLKSLKAFFGGKYLYMITPFQVEEYKSKRVKEVSPATVNRELACIKHMFTMAIQWDKAETNPVKKVKLFRENNQRLRYLEKEEVERLACNCKGYTRRIVIIALNTGMRKGEIFGLKWTDVDFKRGIIYLLNTKNGNMREVPMNDPVSQAFINQPKHKDSAYVFCNKNGRPFKNIRKSFLAALKKTGIINFRFHDLRHTFASQLMMSGVDLNTVRELLGHKSIRMTLRYTHLSPGYKRKAIEVLQRRWTLFGHRTDKKEASFKSTFQNSLKI